jgi:predicted aldo/keto reductase-like oxidoreductase
MRSDIDARGFRNYFQEALRSSLTKLQLEYLDILYLYGPSRAEVLGNAMVKDVLLECRRQGMTRFIGVSFHENEPAMIRGAVEQKIYDVVLTAYNFRQPHRREIEQAIGEAAAAGVGVIAMKTMAGAYWDAGRKVPINSRAALKWVLQNENVHTTIPGVSSYEQLAMNVSVMRDPRLTPQEQSDLRQGEEKKLSGLYCAQCGMCRAQCRYHLEIPTAMRAYMYAHGYRKPDMAQELLASRGGDAFACRQCASRAVTCTMGFSVAERMRDVVHMVSC